MDGDWYGASKITTKNGYVTASLGSLTNFSTYTNINWDQQLYLTINIGGTGAPSWDGEMSPRMIVTAVPYAIAAGKLQTTGATYTSTLAVTAPTVGNQIFVVDDQAAGGTYHLCIQNSVSCGFAAATGAGGYIQNQGASQQATSNFWISGIGRVDSMSEFHQHWKAVPRPVAP